MPSRRHRRFLAGSAMLLLLLPALPGSARGAIEEISIFWGTAHQRAPSGAALPIGNVFEFVLETDGASVQSARFRSPAGAWYDLEQYGAEWEYAQRADAMGLLQSEFGDGDYLVEVRFDEGEPFQTTVPVDSSLSQPQTAPQVVSPAYGESGLGVDVAVSWQAVASPDFSDIVLGIESMDGTFERTEFLEASAAGMTMSNLPPDRAFEGWLVFANLADGETDEGVGFFVARYCESLLLFDTNTDTNRFGTLEHLSILRGSENGREGFAFEAEFSGPVSPSGGPALVSRAALWSPDHWDWILHDEAWSGHIEDNLLGFWTDEAGLLDRLNDGWYALALEFPDGSSAVTPIWFGEPGADPFLAPPQQEPALTAPTPAEGASVQSPVSFAWESLAGDPAVTALYVEISVQETGDPVLAEALAKTATAYGPAALETEGAYRVSVIAANYHGHRTGAAPANPDGIPYEVGRFRMAKRGFSIGEPATASGIPFSWLEGHGLPTDGSVDHQRLYGSPFTVWQEWRAGTNPNDPDDILRMAGPPAPAGQGLRVRWHSVSNRTYRVERSTNLAADPPFAVVAAGIPGVPGVAEFVDEGAPLSSRTVFYRVAVEW